MLLDDLLYPFEPPRHRGMIIQKVERLVVTIWELTALHVWPTHMVCPALLWCYVDEVSEN